MAKRQSTHLLSWCHLCLFTVAVRADLYSEAFCPTFIYLCDVSTAVAGGRLYIDGGSALCTADNVPSSFFSPTISIDLSIPWNNVSFVPDSLPAEDTRLSQTMFFDSADDILYRYGGASGFVYPSGALIAPPLSDLDLSNLDRFWSTSLSQPPRIYHSTIFGLTAKSKDVFYALGGQTSTGSKTLQTYTSRFAQFNMLTKNWSVSSAPSYRNYVTLGQGLYISSFGTEGVLVFLGGVGSNVDYDGALEDMTEIRIFDIKSGKFLFQRATASDGNTLPEPRVSFCVTGAEDAVAGAYDIFMYGGSGNPSGALSKPGSSAVDTVEQSVWVLSLPSFQWTHVPRSATVNGRTRHSCETIGNRQMVVVGGIQDAFLSPDEWHSGIGIFDMAALEWSDGYNPDAAPYQRAQLLVDNAKRTPYPAQWASPELARIFGSENTSSTNTDAIAGGTVGGVAFLATGVVLRLWLKRRKRRHDAEDAQPELPDNEKDQLKHELGGNMRRSELSGGETAHELPG